MKAFLGTLILGLGLFTTGYASEGSCPCAKEGKSCCKGKCESKCECTKCDCGKKEKK